MGNIIIIILAILGPAFIVGGIVGYRKSNKVNVKIISAAAIAAGEDLISVLPSLKKNLNGSVDIGYGNDISNLL